MAGGSFDVGEPVRSLRIKLADSPKLDVTLADHGEGHNLISGITPDFFVLITRLQLPHTVESALMIKGKAASHD